jgi:hypothetical protein
VRNIDISERGAVNVQINATELPAVGTYTYLLVGDEEESDVLQMVLEENNGEIVVSQNYPNPFYDVTTIDCYIPHIVQNAQVQIYNTCGFLIKSLNILERGTVSFEMQADYFPSSGAYTYSLVFDGQTVTDTKQMIVSGVALSIK